MNSGKLNKLQTFLIATDKHRTWFVLFTIFILPSMYILVYLTDGTKNVYAHLTYIIIVFAGATLGFFGGLITGLAAGIMLGPFMPLDVANQIPQTFLNWSFRMLMFTFLGGLIGYITDTLRKSARIVLDLMCHNSETGLPNVNLLNNPDALSYDERNQMLITLLINNFDKIIDLMGLEVYYSLLRRIYEILRDGLPETALIVQCNNNKFWMATPLERPEEDIKKITAILKEGITIENVEYYIEFSLGYTFALNQKQSYRPGAFEKSDHAARYAQKNNLQYMLYRDDIKRGIFEAKLLADFTRALAGDELFLAYQPKVHLKTDKYDYLEALIRWNHPERGLLMPNDFIPLIEETQLIHELTEWVLRRVIEKIRELRKENYDVTISLNISVKNILDKNVVRRLAEIIDNNRDVVNNIEFEIMETILMETIDDTLETIEMYRNLGVAFAIDDFGKGYSSLSYLHRLPVECVKIDRGFTRNLTHDEASQKILQMVIGLCHALNYRVVIEGVEDETTAAIAKNLESDYAQGFYFARPIECGKILDWLKNKNRETSA